MPGTFTFKPIEANLTHNTDLIGRMNPYCAFLVGDEVVKSEVCKKGGKHPHWNDTITIPMDNQTILAVELMDKDTFTPDDNIGNFVIDLKEVKSQGAVSKWYPLTYKNKPAGEILMESIFESDPQTIVIEEETIRTGPGGVLQTETVKTGADGVVMTESITTGPEGVVLTESVTEQAAAVHNTGNVFIEQRQSVEPHVFTKSVDVVETRSVMKEIEVTEPVKVMRDVQYTEVVPVTKEIEVVEPQVVKKTVEVIEPRLVTKTIQVVENVPVMKEIDVIEPRTTIQEVETFEPRTFTKQVEVIEQVPVRKQVQTTEPVIVNRAVEFVEPVITTKTITKELQQPIIVDEKITTTIGPASVIGVESRFQEQVTIAEPLLVTQTVGVVEPLTTQTISTEIREPGMVDEKITTVTSTTEVIGGETEITKDLIVEEERVTKVAGSKKRKEISGGIERETFKQVKLTAAEGEIEQEETTVTYTHKQEVKRNPPRSANKKKGQN